jgi:hypothetical protein
MPVQCVCAWAVEPREWMRSGLDGGRPVPGLHAPDGHVLAQESSVWGRIGEAAFLPCAVSMLSSASLPVPIACRMPGGRDRLREQQLLLFFPTSCRNSCVAPHDQRISTGDIF